ncbi:MAG TPA: response regulator [Methylibium sp.]
MIKRHRVALLGFSAFERRTLESYFRLAGDGTPHYEQYALLPDVVPEPEACDFVLADANHGEVLAVVTAMGREADTVYIGTHLAPPAPAGALASLLRPIDPLQVLREFDAAAARRRRVAPPALAHMLRPEPAPHHPRKPSARTRIAAAQQSLRDFQSTDGHSNSVLTTGGDSLFDHVLVVDDSEIARRFMQVKLQRLGFTVHTVASGAAALELAATRQFAFVFLDVNMEGMDGFEVCKQIRQMPWPLDGRLQRGPVLVMVTARSAPVDRIRGTLAGCDAYLTKPLDEAELIGTLSRHDPCFERVFDDTLPPPLP